jgi:para-aminobenzoate synthetase/4-amino-4-deoxychorismate lyase
MMTVARLDDLRPNRRRSAEFTNQVGEVAANTVGEVAAAIARVEQAAANGLWAVGYVGYEAAPAFDPNLAVRSRPPIGFHGDLPLVWFGFFESRVLNPRRRADLGDYQMSRWRWVDDRDAYEQAVATIREHIAAGDTYQANFTTRLRATFSGDPVAFYHDLAAAQSGGYGTYLDTGTYRIVSASPELFFDRHPTNGNPDRLVTRPMKGTAPRGRWSAEDLIRYEELKNSAKERAENLIIVDLLRNDIGRIADFGTVAVEELMAIERYDTVWQMTSTIVGGIDSSAPLVDVFAALFPSGSVTGAPKVRSMEVIRNLETEPRGVYTGAIGFVAPAGVPGPSASFSVGIRTVVIDVLSGDAEYGIGGGVTFDSDPSAEYEEAALKSKILTHGRSDFELIETMRWVPGKGWYWLDLHLDRLESTADYFGVPVSRLAIVAELDAAVEGCGESRVRLAVDRLGRFSVSVCRFVEDDRQPVAVAIDREPVDTSSPFLYHKTTRREVYEDRLARHPNADDVLLVNGRAELTESTIANVAVKVAGQWCTPPMEAGCLPGVYRRVLLEEGKLVERPIGLDDLAGGSEIALLNSVRLWRDAFLANSSE